MPSLFDVVVFSYVAAIKPEQQIYEVIKAHLDCVMSEMLFIGDHPVLDVEKPISLGMNARLIQRVKGEQLSDVIGDLTSRKLCDS